MCLLLAGCTPAESALSTAIPNALTHVAPETDKVPSFDHIVLIVSENRDYSGVIGSAQLPHLNALASQNVLVTKYFAVSQPSLPNYIALVSGSTANITSDCKECFVNQPNLADLPDIYSSGHSCPAQTADDWVNRMVTKLQASPALGKKSLIFITFDEGGDPGHDRGHRPGEPGKIARRH